MSSLAATETAPAFVEKLPLERYAEPAQPSLVGMPRAMLWGLSVPLVVAASRLGVLDMPGEAYEAAAAELERVAHLCRPDSEAFVNPAKSLALDLAGTLPMIWGTSQLTGVAAGRFACQLNENANYPAIAGVLPEANHNQVVTFDGPFAAGPQAADLVQAGAASASGTSSSPGRSPTNS